jgi:LPXTG-site transpeptidase (sortase) family protein
MAAHERPEYAPRADDALALLQQLIETPLAPPDKPAQTTTAQRRMGQRPDTDDALALLRMLNKLPLAPRIRQPLRVAIHRRPGHIANADESLALLQQLLVSPPAAYDGLLPPLVLRSIDAQRRITLGRYSLNPQFDRLLHRSAQVLAAASLLTLGYWFADGPLHDWLHKRQTQSLLAAHPVAPLAAGSRANVPSPNAAFPFAVAGRAQPAPKGDSIAPYQGQSVATTRMQVHVNRLPSIAPNVPPETAEDAFRDPQQRMLAMAAYATATAEQAAEHDIPALIATQETAEDAFRDPRQRMLAMAAYATATAEHDLLAPQQLMPVKPAATAVELATVPDFLAPQPLPAAQPATAADPRPTHLLIPSINVDTPVVEVFVVDDTWDVAEYAAGYLEGTGLPGDPGNMGIAGHLGLRGGVFANLSSLVDAANWRYHYRVNGSQVIWPTQVEILDPTLDPTLTLLTCTNWDTQRLAVTANLVDSQPL